MVFYGIEILQVEILQAHPTIAEKVHLYFLFIYDFLIFLFMTIILIYLTT